MHKKDFSYYVTRYFTNYLDREAGFSPNTIKSYRDTFILFFRYIELFRICKINKLNMDILSADNVNDFLNWIEKERQCTVSSRNQRLAALKSFCIYVIRENPEKSDICQQVLGIRAKKATQKSIGYLNIEAISYLLKMPDKTSDRGIRDLALLALLYETGCRVQEIIDLKIGDISFRIPNTVALTGKGNKIRVVPISQQVSEIIKNYLSISTRHNFEENIFVNRLGNPLSRSGVAYILNKYGDMSRKNRLDLYPYKLHPHILRHSKAMHLLENNVNLIYIRDFLGHSSVTTTEIYARCNPELKRKYIEEASNFITETVQDYSKTEKNDLLEWLRKNI
ncbi:tyrosine-type recombinase/integrase [Clostridium autoethanogenum]|uniref:Site-specific integrase n=1 Tax=Clostridium autoethanogenum DSM 10061 TaxID=1341692 RepID=A0ABM5NXT9_9CLOT|nr:tyrosine-type recombinase/integrase [Clostridium autoethanogenum]AGY77273.1 site-specific integrase [Clostridium autoethanogenum DSM 10061]ALU37415.1 Integrase family protein [Clostridium autoethanogenum DSM 10061]OVY48486.1 Tyrosine recombinase XerD [Clostridium autoethanogenum]